jgi:hypothetical protein
VTGAANFLQYLGDAREQIHAPGYQRIDMTLTKELQNV